MSADGPDDDLERDQPSTADWGRGEKPVSEPPTGTPILVSAPATEPPPDRFSVLRLLIALVVIAIGGAAAAAIVVGIVTREDANDEQWFAPYVDVTLTPQLDFQDPSVNPNLDVVLAFVVASADDPCEPSWGGYYGLDEAATSLDLDRRIARQRQRGGDVIVSFGGIANDELATGCSDPAELVDAYGRVVTRYDARTIDLDLEGAALADPEIASRRATAMATLQADASERGGLDIWLTLPVSPTGLTAEGVAALDAMLAAGVDVAGVNVMTMDFGASRDAETDMVTASVAAVDATQVQLVAAYAARGTTLSPAAAYARIGVTPMIGQNDVPADRLDTSGAQDLVEQTRARGILRYSMWSLNRDAPCGGNVDTVIVSNTCSGVDQTRLEFSAILSTVGGRPVDDRAESPAVVRGSATEAATDAANPYDTWRERREYDARAEVVWAGQVYVAKWWNVGIAPDAPVEHEWDSPWRLVGPVLESDATVTTATTLPEGTFAEWTRDSGYDAGDWVQRRGVVYRAKWWTRGADPAANVDNPWENPWEPVGPDDLDAATATTTTTTTTAPVPTTTTAAPPSG